MNRSDFFFGILLASAFWIGFTASWPVGRAANVEQTVTGSNGVSVATSTDGRTLTVSPSPSTTQAGTTYTFANTDCGTEVKFTNGSAVTATIPQTLPVDCTISVLQLGAGQVAVNGSAVAAATLHSPYSYTKTAALYSILAINVYSNSNGTSAIAAIAGDGA